MRKNSLCVLSALALGLVSTTAQAVCPTTPTDYDSEDCSVNEGATTVCTQTASTFTCDFSGAGGASTLVLVSSYDATYFIEAWGNWDGEDFCCHTTGGWTGDNVIVNGSAYGDSLALSSASWGYLEYDTGDPNDPLISVEVWGGNGNDTIHGSSETQVVYYEELYGEGGQDTIHGHEGADYISGGLHGDTLNGNAGDDTMYGNEGDDIMAGGDGEDSMYGNGGVDYMGGGNNDDLIDGGEGGDVMCGDGEDNKDVIYDGDGTAETWPDKIWAANNADWTYCQDSSTYWDNYSNDMMSNCGSALLSRPPQCP